MLKKEQELLTELKTAQKEELEALEKEKKSFSEYKTTSATEDEDTSKTTDIDKNKERWQAGLILSHKKLINDAIEHISSKITPEVDERVKECNAINAQCQAFDPKGKQKSKKDTSTSQDFKQWYRRY